MLRLLAKQSLEIEIGGELWLLSSPCADFSSEYRVGKRCHTRISQGRIAIIRLSIIENRQRRRSLGDQAGDDEHEPERRHEVVDRQ